MLCSLRKFDGLWFPAAIAFYNSWPDEPPPPGVAPSTKLRDTPAIVVEVISATFNRPDHPKRLTAAHIGVEPKMNVLSYRGEEFQSLFYDGERVVTLKQLRKRKIQDGPTLVAFKERQRIPDRLSRWEIHTKRFIKMYKLGGGQRVSAMAILKDCRRRVEAVGEPTNDQLRDIEIKQLVPRLNASCRRDRGRPAKRRTPRSPPRARR